MAAPARRRQRRDERVHHPVGPQAGQHGHAPHVADVEGRPPGRRHAAATTTTTSPTNAARTAQTFDGQAGLLLHKKGAL